MCTEDVFENRTQSSTEMVDLLLFRTSFQNPENERGEGKKHG